MRSFVATRVVPFALMFLASVAVSAVAMVAMYARGMAFALGPWGALIHVPVVAAMALAMWAVLARTKQLRPEQMGFARRPGAPRDLALWTLTAVGIVVGIAATLHATGVARLVLAASRPSMFGLAVGFVALLGSAAFQQLIQQGFVLAASRGGRPSIATVAFAALLFAASHIDANATALALLNDALFAVLSSVLFFRGPSPSFGAPIGLHAGWNFALTFVLGCPVGDGEAGRVGLFRWPTGERLLSGGALGLHSGLGCTLALCALIAALARTSLAQAAVPQPDRA
jgi:hypothetical protein